MAVFSFLFQYSLKRNSASLILFSYFSFTVTSGWCLTGKLTEFAIKQNSRALVCSSMAFATMSSLFTVTCGCSVTSVKRPFPSFSSRSIPSAVSTYASTITLFAAQKCRYHSIWQEESDDTRKSSGLCRVLSPRKAGSDEPRIKGLFSTAMVWLRS